MEENKLTEELVIEYTKLIATTNDLLVELDPKRRFDENDVDRLDAQKAHAKTLRKEFKRL